MTSKLLNIKKKILPLLRRNAVKKASIFGSYARGENTKKSDIDMMIEFSKKKSLLDLIGLEQELKDKTGIKFDISTYNSINHLIKNQVMSEQVQIL